MLDVSAFDFAKHTRKRALNSERQLKQLLEGTSHVQILSAICYLNQTSEINDEHVHIEHGHMPSPEYAGHIALSVDRRARPSNDYHAVARAIERANRLCGIIAACKMTSVIPHGPIVPGDERDTLTRLLRQDAGTRSPFYPHHYLDVMRAVFEPFEKVTEEVWGLTYSESVAIREAVPRLLKDRINTANKQLFDKVEALYDELVKYKRTGALTSVVRREIKPQDRPALRELSTRRLRRIVQAHESAKFMAHLHEHMCFSDADVSSHTGIAANRVAAFLKRFSTERTSHHLTRLPDELFRATPLIQYGRRFLLISPASLDSCVEKPLETLLRQNPRTSSTFDTHRHDVLARKSSECLMRLFNQNARVTFNGYYHKSKSERNEIDALIEYDDRLLVIEAKGAGRPSSLTYTNLNKSDSYWRTFVAHPAEQIKSFMQAFADSKTIDITDGTKTIRTLRSAALKDVLGFVVTFEPIGSIAPFLRTVGKSITGADPFKRIWHICLFDLLVITELLETPACLFHYLEARDKALEMPKIEFFEELDIFGWYLDNGLHLDYLLEKADEAKVDWITMGPTTDRINGYYAGRNGGHDVPMPRLPLASGFMELLQAIDSSGCRGRTEASLHLIRFNTKAQEGIISAIAKCKSQVAIDHDYHDCAWLTKAADFGLAFMNGPIEIDLFHRMLRYLNFKSGQREASKWIGICDVGIGKYAIRAIQSIDRSVK